MGEAADFDSFFFIFLSLTFFPFLYCVPIGLLQSLEDRSGTFRRDGLGVRIELTNYLLLSLPVSLVLASVSKKAFLIL